jgi:acetyl esterase
MPVGELPAGFAVEQQSYVSGGTRLPLLVQQAGEGRGAALVYFHGGGFALGDASATAQSTARLASASDCVVVSADYRLAPEHPYPAAHDDAVAALEWVHDHAGELGVDAASIAGADDAAAAEAVGS